MLRTRDYTRFRRQTLSLELNIAGIGVAAVLQCLSHAAGQPMHS